MTMHRKGSHARTLSDSQSSESLANSNMSDSKSLRTITTATGSHKTAMDDEKQMFLLEMNPFSPESVVLLHIVFSCHLEWKQVWPKLAEYHLLIPDLPCHSGSRGMCRKEDFSIELCADLVAEMIRARAHDGRAHIVGLSTGGFIALDLARRHPEVVKSAFISGAWPFTGIRSTTAAHPRLVYTALWSILHSPGYLFFKASGLGGEYQNDELLHEIKGNGSSRLAKAASLSGWNEERLAECANPAIRMCLVGGAKFDKIEEARRAADVLERSGAGHVPVYAVRNAIHAWNLQFPVLFAKGIQCWIEGRPLPPEFEAIPSSAAADAS